MDAPLDDVGVLLACLVAVGDGGVVVADSLHGAQAGAAAAHGVEVIGTEDSGAVGAGLASLDAADSASDIAARVVRCELGLHVLVVRRREVMAAGMLLTYPRI
jgi:hypothetical protein